MGIDLYSLNGEITPQRLEEDWPYGGWVDTPSGGSVRVKDGIAHFEAGSAGSWAELREYVDSVAPGVRYDNPAPGDDDGVSAEGAAQLAAALTDEIESGRAEAHYAAKSSCESVKADVQKIIQLRDFLLVSASDGGFEVF